MNELIGSGNIENDLMELEEYQQKLAYLDSPEITNYGNPEKIARAKEIANRAIEQINRKIRQKQNIQATVQNDIEAMNEAHKAKRQQERAEMNPVERGFNAIKDYSLKTPLLGGELASNIALGGGGFLARSAGNLTGWKGLETIGEKTMQANRDFKNLLDIENSLPSYFEGTTDHEWNSVGGATQNVIGGVGKFMEGYHEFAPLGLATSGVGAGIGMTGKALGYGEKAVKTAQTAANLGLFASSNVANTSDYIEQTSGKFKPIQSGVSSAASALAMEIAFALGRGRGMNDVEASNYATRMLNENQFVMMGKKAFKQSFITALANGGLNGGLGTWLREEFALPDNATQEDYDRLASNVWEAIKHETAQGAIWGGFGAVQYHNEVRKLFNQLGGKKTITTPDGKKRSVYKTNASAKFILESSEKLQKEKFPNLFEKGSIEEVNTYLDELFKSVPEKLILGKSAEFGEQKENFKAALLREYNLAFVEYGSAFNSNNRFAPKIRNAKENKEAQTVNSLMANKVKGLYSQYVAAKTAIKNIDIEIEASKEDLQKQQELARQKEELQSKSYALTAQLEKPYSVYEMVGFIRQALEKQYGQMPEFMKRVDDVLSKYMSDNWHTPISADEAMGVYNQIAGELSKLDTRNVYDDYNSKINNIVNFGQPTVYGNDERNTPSSVIESSYREPRQIGYDGVIYGNDERGALPESRQLGYDGAIYPEMVNPLDRTMPLSVRGNEKPILPGDVVNEQNRIRSTQSPAQSVNEFPVDEYWYPSNDYKERENTPPSVRTKNGRESLGIKDNIKSEPSVQLNDKTIAEMKNNGSLNIEQAPNGDYFVTGRLDNGQPIVASGLDLDTASKVITSLRETKELQNRPKMDMPRDNMNISQPKEQLPINDRISGKSTSESPSSFKESTSSLNIPQASKSENIPPRNKMKIDSTSKVGSKAVRDSESFDTRADMPQSVMADRTESPAIKNERGKMGLDVEMKQNETPKTEAKTKINQAKPQFKTTWNFGEDVDTSNIKSDFKLTEPSELSKKIQKLKNNTDWTRIKTEKEADDIIKQIDVLQKELDSNDSPEFNVERATNSLGRLKERVEYQKKNIQYQNRKKAEKRTPWKDPHEKEIKALLRKAEFDKKVVKGYPTKMTTKANGGMEVEGQFGVVDVNDLQTATSIGETQNRNRETISSQAQINSIGNNPNPEYLIVNNPDSANGAMVVTTDGKVLSGNGRTLGLKMAYESGNAEKYKAYLREHAKEFGIDPKDVDKIKNPVLVRIIDPKDGFDVKRFVKESNESQQLARNAAEIARTDAENIKGILRDFNSVEDIASSSNKEFIQKFFDKTVGNTERAMYLAEDGSLTPDGRRRVENALIASLYGDNPRLIEKLTNTTNEGIKNIANALISTARDGAKLKGEIDKGRFFDIDFTKEIGDAALAYADTIAEMKRQGVKPLDSKGNGTSPLNFYLKNMKDRLTPESKLIFGMLSEMHKSPKQTREFLQIINDVIRSHGDPQQGDLFAGKKQKPSKSQVIKEVLQEFDSRYKTDFSKRDLSEWNKSDRTLFGSRARNKVTNPVSDKDLNNFLKGQAKQITKETGLKFKVVDSVEELSKIAGEQLDAKTEGGIQGDTIYIVRGNVDKERFPLLIAHEVAGHRGVEALFDNAEQMDSFFKSLERASDRDRFISDAFAEVDRLGYTKNRSREAMAKIVERVKAESGTLKGTAKTFVNFITSRVRRLLRRMGFKNLQLNEAEVYDIAVQALRRTGLKNSNKFFGLDRFLAKDNSFLAATSDERKQLDQLAEKAGYNIKQVFHGGTVDGSFDTNRGEGGAFGKGAYFTNGWGAANEYAKVRGGQTKEYYLKMQKPFDSREPLKDSKELNKLFDILKQRYNMEDWELRRIKEYGAGELSKQLTKHAKKEELSKGFWKGGDLTNSLLRESGFDGIIAPLDDYIDTYQYVIFNPEQAKLADSKSFQNPKGEFLSSRPRTREEARSPKEFYGEKRWNAIKSYKKNKGVVDNLLPTIDEEMYEGYEKLPDGIQAMQNITNNGELLADLDHALRYHYKSDIIDTLNHIKERVAQTYDEKFADKIAKRCDRIIRMTEKGEYDASKIKPISLKELEKQKIKEMPKTDWDLDREYYKENDLIDPVTQTGHGWVQRGDGSYEWLSSIGEKSITENVAGKRKVKPNLTDELAQKIIDEVGEVRNPKDYNAVKKIAKENMAEYKDLFSTKKNTGYKTAALKLHYLTGYKMKNREVEKNFRTIKDFNVLKKTAGAYIRNIIDDKSAQANLLDKVVKANSFEKVYDIITNTNIAKEKELRQNTLNDFVENMKNLKAKKVSSSTYEAVQDIIDKNFTREELDGLLNTNEFTTKAVSKLRDLADGIASGLGSISKTDVEVAQWAIDNARKLKKGLNNLIQKREEGSTALNVPVEKLAEVNTLLNRLYQQEKEARKALDTSLENAAVADKQKILAEAPEAKNPNSRDTYSLGTVKENLAPVTAVNSLDNDNITAKMGKTMHKVAYENLLEGQNRQDHYRAEGYKVVDDIYQSFGKNGDLRDGMNNLNETAMQVETSKGHKYDITKGEVLAAVATYMDSETRQIIDRAGGVDFFLGAKRDSDYFTLTTEKLKEMTDSLTPLEKKALKKGSRLLSQVFLPAINETHERLNGVPLRIREDGVYFPRFHVNLDESIGNGIINRDSAPYLHQQMNADYQAMLKQRNSKARPSLMLKSFPEVLNSYVDQGALYIGMAEPLRHLNRVMTEGMKRELISRYGKEYVDRITTLTKNMAGMAGRTDADRGLSNRFLSNIAAAKLTPVSALKQFSSVPLASSIIDFKYLAKAALSGLSNENIKEMMELDGMVLRYRNNGIAGIIPLNTKTWEGERQLQKHSNKWYNKIVDTGLNLSVEADKRALGIIYKATKLMAEAKGKGNDKAWIEKTFMDAVRRTQNTTDLASANGWQMKSRESAHWSFLNMYQNQTQKIGNEAVRLYRGMKEAEKQHGKDSAQYKEAKGRAVDFAIGVAVMNVMAIGTGAVAGSILHKKDEKETTRQKVADFATDTMFNLTGNPILKPVMGGSSYVLRKSLPKALGGSAQRTQSEMFGNDFTNLVPDTIYTAGKIFEEINSDDPAAKKFRKITGEALRSKSFENGLAMGRVPTWFLRYPSQLYRKYFVDESKKTKRASTGSSGLRKYPIKRQRRR